MQSSRIRDPDDGQNGNGTDNNAPDDANDDPDDGDDGDGDTAGDGDGDGADNDTPQAEATGNTGGPEATEANKDGSTGESSPSSTEAQQNGGTQQQTEESGVDIDDSWMGVLFEAIKQSAGGAIDEAAWKKVVKGPWAEPMWSAFQEGSTKAEIANSSHPLSQEGFEKDWDNAVNAAFKVLGGGDDGVIKQDEIEEWSAETYEKTFAVQAFLKGDQEMDRGEFEEFLYTIILFHCVDANSNALIDWEEVEKAPEGIKAKLPADKAAFASEFGENGMDLAQLWQYEKINKAFFPPGEKPKKEDTEPKPEAKVESAVDTELADGGDNGPEPYKLAGIRAILAPAAIPVILFCAWQ
jgi:hypothetical protein